MAADPTSGFPFDLIAGGYGTAGPGLADAALILLATSIFAALASFHTIVVRYLYSAGRDQVVPATLGRVNPRNSSPSNASHAVTAVALLVLVAFAVRRGDPVAGLFAWGSYIGAVGILALMIGSSLAVVGFFATTPRPAPARGRVGGRAGRGGAAHVRAVAHDPDQLGHDDPRRPVRPTAPEAVDIPGRRARTRPDPSQHVATPGAGSMGEIERPDPGRNGAGNCPGAGRGGPHWQGRHAMSVDVESGVLVASPVEVARLSMVLSAAFADNPVSDWLFDGDQDRHNPAFFAAYLTCAMSRGRVEQTSDGTAVAVWIDLADPWPAEQWLTFLDDVAQAVGVHQPRWDVFEEAALESGPTEPHWWLAFLGVLPAHQGRGHGGRLLDHAANWVGTRPAYLEATSRRLAGFYRRHGWHDTGPLTVPAGPVLHRMRLPTPDAPALENGSTKPDPVMPHGERTEPSGSTAGPTGQRANLPGRSSRAEWDTSPQYPPRAY